MKILHAYVLRSLMLNFFVGLFIFILVLFMGTMLKEADRLIQGVSIGDFARLFMLFIPYLASICVPMAFLTAILLIFGRLSQDNEILAMKASGISIYQICYPIWIIGAFLTLMSFKNNNEIIPFSHFAARKLMVEMGLKNPTAYLEPGSFVEIFPGHIIYIREREGDVLKRIVIYQTVSKNHVKTITAKEGRIFYDAKTYMINLELKDGTIQEPAEENSQDIFTLQFGHYTVTLDASKVLKTPDTLEKKHKDMTISEIQQRIKEYRDKGIGENYITALFTEIQKKISISFSCLSFSLIGIPLGIRAHRSEKTVGIGLSLLLVFFYYLFIIFGKALDEHPAFHPEWLMWVPNFVLSVSGICLLRKISR